MMSETENQQCLQVQPSPSQRMATLLEEIAESSWITWEDQTFGDIVCGTSHTLWARTEVTWRELDM